MSVYNSNQTSCNLLPGININPALSRKIIQFITISNLYCAPCLTFSFFFLPFFLSPPSYNLANPLLGYDWHLVLWQPAPEQLHTAAALS